MRLVALFAILCLGACATAPGPLQSLQGRWKATGSTAYLSDGTTVAQSPPCWIEFVGERVSTECHFGSTVSRLMRANREIAPGRMESEVIESASGAPPVGSRSRIEYRIAAGTLFTTSYPTPPKQPTARYPLRVEATWVRDPAPGR
jgi:hypothetical protein